MSPVVLFCIPFVPFLFLQLTALRKCQQPWDLEVCVCALFALTWFGGVASAGFCCLCISVLSPMVMLYAALKLADITFIWPNNASCIHRGVAALLFEFV